MWKQFATQLPYPGIYNPMAELLYYFKNVLKQELIVEEFRIKAELDQEWDYLFVLIVQLHDVQIELARFTFHEKKFAKDYAARKALENLKKNENILKLIDRHIQETHE